MNAPFVSEESAQVSYGQYLIYSRAGVGTQVGTYTRPSGYLFWPGFSKFTGIWYTIWN